MQGYPTSAISPDNPSHWPAYLVLSIPPGDIEDLGGLLSTLGFPSGAASAVMAKVERDGQTMLRRGRQVPVCIVRRDRVRS